MKKLEWDSDFWGIEVYHLDNTEKFNKDIVTSKNVLVQALTNVKDLEYIHDLEGKGFKFRENRVTLSKNYFDKCKIDNSNFRKMQNNDLSQYREIIFNLFRKYSRFNIFSDNKLKTFYYTWLVNSIEGKMDDECIGYFIDNKLAGFLTYRLEASVLRIGLFGVLPEFQGQGISLCLLSYVDEIALKNNVKKVMVATQGKNIKALNTYIKNGYSINSIDQWYYFMKGEIN